MMPKTLPLDDFAFTVNTDAEKIASTLKEAFIGKLYPKGRIGGWFSNLTGRSAHTHRKNLNKMLDGRGQVGLQPRGAQLGLENQPGSTGAQVAELYSHVTNPGSGVRLRFRRDIGGQAQELLRNRKAVEKLLAKDPARLTAFRKLQDMPSYVDPRTNKMLGGAQAARKTRRSTIKHTIPALGILGAAGAGTAHGVGAFGQPEELQNPGATEYYGPPQQGGEGLIQSGANSVGNLLANLSPAAGQWVKSNPYLSAGIGAGGGALLLYALMSMLRGRQQQY